MAFPKDQNPETMVYQSSRERACQLLRNKAREYHEYAVQLEKLADCAVHFNPEQDEALWRLITGIVPR